MTRTIIPKDCAVCDVCNAQVTDDKFVALSEATWCEGYLYCKDCQTDRPKDLPVVMKIKRGDDLSNTELAQPIVFESFGDES